MSKERRFSMESIKREYGREILSTKSSGKGIIAFQVICVVVGLIFAIAISSVCSLAHSQYDYLFGSSNADSFVCILAFALFFALPIFYLVINIFAMKSHCVLYENAVTGTTLLANGMKSFILSYDDIVGVTETKMTKSKRRICIQTKYDKYEVLAFKNADEAIKTLCEKTENNR